MLTFQHSCLFCTPLHMCQKLLESDLHVHLSFLERNSPMTCYVINYRQCQSLCYFLCWYIEHVPQDVCHSLSIFLKILTCFVRFCFKVIVFEVMSILTEVDYSEDTFSIALFLYYVTANYILHVDRCLQSRILDPKISGIRACNVIIIHLSAMLNYNACYLLISMTISD